MPITYGLPVTVWFDVAVNVADPVGSGFELLVDSVAVHWLVQATVVDADACTFDGGIDVEDGAT
jgi:hypothetical protein